LAGTELVNEAVIEDEVPNAIPLAGPNVTDFPDSDVGMLLVPDEEWHQAATSNG
jgi:hypothetical protein